MTEPTKNEAPKLPPIIRGFTPQGRTPAELTLWMNENVEANDKAPDMTGTVKVGGETIRVSAWVRPGGVSAASEGKEAKEYGPFVSVVANFKDEAGNWKSENLGTVQAMLRTTVNGEKIDVDGSRGLKMIGELKGETVLTQGALVSGNLNTRHPDRDNVLACAEQLGFKPAMIEGFKQFIEADRKQSAKP